MDNTNTYKNDRGFRLVDLLERLKRGELVIKPALAAQYGVSEKTIQRDIDDLRSYLHEANVVGEERVIRFDKVRGGYCLVNEEMGSLSTKEVLALCKILLESRAFTRVELDPIIKKLTAQVVQADRASVNDIIRNELFYYIPLKHGKELLDSICNLSQYINRREIVKVNYSRLDGAVNERLIKPVAVMFSEFYFYLIAFLADDSKDSPTVFRIDRILNYKGTGEYFHIPYSKRFSDGEFRKRVQFMYAGELRRVTFEYHGESVEAVLDRLPTAEILEHHEGYVVIRAEAFGSGIDMWLRSQGDWVRAINP